MKTILRKDESGVSEVIGTILILAMTVVLFATIIIWVTNVPTPVAATRLEVDASLNVIYDNGGAEIGANVTLRHLGGEALDFFTTTVYVTTRTGSTDRTDILKTKGDKSGIPYGLIDGSDTTWNAGERWNLKNYSIRPSTDTVVVTIADNFKGVVLWSSQLNPPAGDRPPLFLEKWADSIPQTSVIDEVETGFEFWVMAKVSDPDGDLNAASVYGILTIFYGTGDSCALPQRMYDDGTHGDRTPYDGVFVLSRTCMRSPSLDWDGAIVLFNATDDADHTVSSRLTLRVVPGPDTGTGGGGSNFSGRPANLRWNGRQGYNIFNATEWDRFKYTADETRTFRGSEEVVVVVGSLDLENTFDTNGFMFWDPFSGTPAQAVVYGSSKTVVQTSIPSSTQAFTFLEFINGYYIYTYRFKLNDAATVGTNYLKAPLHPPNYYFAQYTLDIHLFSSSGLRFNTTDAVTITDEDNYVRDFPKIETFSDGSFTLAATTFVSTEVVYVQVKMFTVDPVLTAVVFGNIVIKDYNGGTQMWRAPINGNDVNTPICRIDGTTCSGASDAITIVGVSRVYRFSINLTRANQDPWVEGRQNYALSVTNLKDTDEAYTNIATQLVIVAPLYKLDIVAGTDAATNNAWGTKDYSYYHENLNGIDRWRTDRIEFCGLSGTCKMQYHTISIVYLDFDQDGDLDTASSIFVDNQNGEVALHRRDLDSQGNVIFTRFLMQSLASLYCNVLATGDVTGDGAPEVVCGASNGHVWYYKNDGSWQGGAATKLNVDTTRPREVRSLAIGDFNGDGANDVAVGGATGRLTWYPNLDRLGTFQNIGISDDWFADGELTVVGNVTSGSYLNTFVSDNGYEQVREYTFTEPVRSGGTTNAGVDVSATGWTYADWQDPGSAASGTWQSSGGNGGGYLEVSTNWVVNQVVAGYWTQSFSVAGSPPFTAQLNLDWRVVTFGATGGNVQLFAFVDKTPGAPAFGQHVWTSTAQSGATTWTTTPLPVDVSNRITGAGTYYLKVAMYTQNAGSGSASVGGFDNVGLTWSSTGGLASELEHYWRITRLPARASTTFTLTLEARHSANFEGDFFEIAYATGSGDPRTWTYTPILWMNQTSDTTYSYILPAAVTGQVVAIRARDMDHRVGNLSLDTLFVDQMYIRASTPIGTTGVDLVVLDNAAVTAIDADNQNGDGFDDIVIGTANSHVYKYAGSSGGLQTPAGAFATTGSAVVGVKFGNVSGTQSGLEVVVAFGTTVRVLTGFGDTGTVITNALPTYSPTNAITAFSVGDINGDGPDDVAVGTTTDVFIWINQNNGVSWSSAIRVSSVGANVYWLDLGDAGKAQYLGR